jgi:predicted amidohydrolase
LSGSVLKVAIAQASPALLDGPASVETVRDRIAAAGRDGVQLLAFPETFVPGYPFWADAGTFGRWEHGPSKEVHRRLLDNALEVPGEATGRIGQACADAGVVAVVGVHERDRRGRTLWNALLTFDADGRLAGHHRKLVPTFGERMVWMQGDAAGLRVHRTAAGPVGGLICWEHWMPAPRQVLHDGGEAVHVAAWPHVREAYLLASRHYAFEGRCFVLAAGMVLHRDQVPADFPADLMPPAEDMPDGFLLAGGSCILGPGAEMIAGPAGPEETLLAAELDLERIGAESLSLDTGGHYARPDLFRLQVDRRRPGSTSDG